MRSTCHTQLAKLSFDQKPFWSISQLKCTFLFFQYTEYITHYCCFLL